jgi:hypothetical protein
MYVPTKITAAARAKAAALRAQVDATDAAELSARVYASSYTGKRITDPADAWTMTAEDFAMFQERMNAPEYCPALVAESAARAAEATLVEAARVLPGCDHVTPDRLNCTSPSNRREYVRLLLEMTA